MNNETILESLEGFIQDQKAEAARQAALETAVQSARKLHRSWAPLLNFCSSIGLLPIEASTNGLERDWTYSISRIAMKRPSLYIPVMKRLAVHAKNREQLRIEKGGTTPENWNQLWNFFRELDDAGAVAELKKDVRSISCLVNSDYLRYFDGDWAEKGLLYLVEKTVKDFSQESRKSHSLFWNVKLARNQPWNTAAFELDSVACVDDRTYVFEVKTGALLPIDKWFARWQLFERPGRSVFVQCSAGDFDYRPFMPLHLFSLANFERLFKARLRRDFAL